MTQVPLRVTPGVPPKEQMKTWVKFIWDSLRQVDGFVPKLKAVGRIISILKNR